MQKFRRFKSIFLISAFTFASLATAGTGFYLRNVKTAADTKAASPCKCTDSNVCYPDGCSRKPKTADNKFEEARYDSVCAQYDPGYRIPDSLLSYFCTTRQPDCCFDIYTYHDSRLCCWQERYSCHPSLCTGSSGGDGCGKYWSLPNNWPTYGCVKKEGSNTVPMFGPLPPNLPINQPTNTPIPVATNTPVPAATNTPIPAQPTNTPRPLSTNTPVPTNTSVPPRPTDTPRPGQPTNTPYPSNTPAPNGPYATSTPQPTAPPGQPTYTPLPTNPIYTPSPTHRPEDSNENEILRANGNNENDNRPIFSLPQMPQLPQIEVKSPKELAREVVTFEKVQSLENATEKPMKSVTMTYKTVKKYDQQLEVSVESFFDQIKRQIMQLISSL